MPTAHFADYVRWGGTTELAHAAAEVESGYKPLADALRKPIEFVSAFKAEGPEFEQALAAARKACADL